ncbi:TetR/AcrR family transcriptional regulator [Novosphingobium sp. BL-52-GroH]|uniref:TetR/AcrR family transcriptional regulator n=1 Tax=Novosphingobium sp. BL-52-GroH TaxID=3349877 RepID=UPI00384C4E26
MAELTIPDRPRAARSAQRRQHLLDTARRLFVEKGFHQAGMAQIAKASGIAIGQIYRDFANKEAIVAAICEANLIAWLEEEKLQAAVDDGDAPAIRNWVKRIVTDELAVEDRRLMSELLAEAGRNPTIAAINRKEDARLRSSLDSALSSLAPAASECQRATIADFIISLAWAMLARSEMYPHQDHGMLRQYVADLLDRELTALGSHRA